MTIAEVPWSTRVRLPSAGVLAGGWFGFLRNFVWVDYYASADPVPNGPITDPDPGGAAPGWPCEVLVHNRASWFPTTGAS